MKLFPDMKFKITYREDERHVLLFCPLYEDTRKELFNRACMNNTDFLTYSPDEKFNFLLSDKRIIKFRAKTCSMLYLKCVFSCYPDFIKLITILFNDLFTHS